LSKPDDPPSSELRQTRRGTWSAHFSKKVFLSNASIAQGSFQCVAIHLGVKGEHYPSTVGVLHLDMASFAMDFRETKSLQRGENLPARPQGQLHIVNSTISRSFVAANSVGDGSKYKSMASRIFSNACWRVLPCDQQLFNDGQCATK
jgi:hypothetical protein